MSHSCSSEAIATHMTKIDRVYSQFESNSPTLCVQGNFSSCQTKNFKHTLKKLGLRTTTHQQYGMFSICRIFKQTTNNIEGWHSKLNQVIRKPHPNVFEVVKTYKAEQALTEVMLAQLAAGARQSPQGRCVSRKKARITELNRRFGNNEVNLDQYVTAMAGDTDPGL